MNKSEDLRIGMYVRSANINGIGEIVGIVKCDNLYDITIEYENARVSHPNMHKSEKYNASKDLIDLIEVGDYVNGVKVHKIFNENGTIGLLDDRNDGINFAYHDGIKEVLTKEQYEREVFRV